MAEEEFRQFTHSYNWREGGYTAIEIENIVS